MAKGGYYTMLSTSLVHLKRLCMFISPPPKSNAHGPGPWLPWVASLQWLLQDTGCSISWLLCHLVVSRSLGSHPNSSVSEEAKGGRATTQHLTLKRRASLCGSRCTGHVTSKGCWEIQFPARQVLPSPAPEGELSPGW